MTNLVRAQTTSLIRIIKIVLESFIDGSCTDGSHFLGSNETDTIRFICNSQYIASDPSQISWNKNLICLGDRALLRVIDKG